MRVAEALEERAIVRHEHHGAAILGEKGLEPRDRLDVEVIGRLVEQQQIGLADQRAREQHAALPSARQRVDDRRPAAAPAASSPCRPGDAAAIHRAHRARRGLRRPLGDRAIRRQRHVLHQPRDANARLAQHEPESGCRSPLRICSSVDLPVPLRPMTAMRSPASTWKAISSSSGRWPKATETRSSATSGMESSSVHQARQASRPTGHQAFDILRRMVCPSPYRASLDDRARALSRPQLSAERSNRRTPRSKRKRFSISRRCCASTPAARRATRPRRSTT